MTTQQSLTHFVEDFKQWIEETYPGEGRTNYMSDCSSYPRWNEIDVLFTRLLKDNELSLLDPADKANLLYLIACGWDSGDSLISWMLEDSPALSAHGNLPESDFLDLTRLAIALKGEEYYDAKFQLAASFSKFGSLTPEREDLLLQLYETDDEYTKRRALYSLAHLKYPKIMDLVERSWQTNNEYQRIGALSVLHINIKNADLIRKYLKEAQDDTREHLAEYVRVLSAEYQLKSG